MAVRLTLLLMVTLGLVATAAPQNTTPPIAAAVLQIPATLSDSEFWHLVTDLSEGGGRFAPQLMSNEDSAQFVLPALRATVPEGLAYIGVGSEPNFTYAATIRPSIAFIVDIRRDNMLEHLMYKALFELSPDRVTFVSRLFSRVPPTAVSAGATGAQLFEALRGQPADDRLLEQTGRLVAERLITAHRFSLLPIELNTIGGFLTAFRTAGPDSLKGYGDGMMLTYAQLMTATDLDGHAASYLESDAAYQRVRTLQQRNLVVPVTGDFAGEHALSSIGAFLQAHHATVGAFYVSNVERYLFEQGAHGREFYRNVATLPLNGTSVFIRSVTTDISRRMNIPIPDGPARWRTFLVPVRVCLTGIADGSIQEYRDLFTTR